MCKCVGNFFIICRFICVKSQLHFEAVFDLHNKITEILNIRKIQFS
jgi:hypothetical protein